MMLWGRHRKERLGVSKSENLLPSGLMASPSMIAYWQSRLDVARTIEDTARHGRCGLDASLPSLKLTWQR